MPLSQDNQDYKTHEDQSKDITKLDSEESKKEEGALDTDAAMDSDDLKGKKVDADPTKEEGKPADV